MSDGICKHCGAMLPMPDMEGNASCMSCGRTSRITAPTQASPAPTSTPSSSYGSTPMPGAGTNPVPGTTSGQGSNPGGPFTTWTPGAAGPGSVPTSTNKAVRTGCGCGLASVLVVPFLLALIGVALAFSINGSTDVSVNEGVGTPTAATDLSHLHPSGEVMPLGDLGAAPAVDVVSMLYDGPANQRTVGRLNLGAGVDPANVIWQSLPLEPDVYSVLLAQSGDTIFVGAGKQVRALSAATGEQLWVASLSDEVTVGCEPCFDTVEGNLVVRTADAQVTAFGTTSAEPRWSRRLLSAAATLRPQAGGVVVIDEVDGSPGTYDIEVVDPSTGSARSTFQPSCPSDGPIAYSVHLGDPILAVPGTTDLIAVVTFGDGCVVRWNGANGEAVWNKPMPQISPVDSERGLITDDRYLIPGSGGLVSVDLTSGDSAVLAAPAETSVRPVAVVGDVVVADATSTRGTAKGSLVAWRSGSIEPIWQVDMSMGSKPFRDPTGATAESISPGDASSVVISSADQIWLFTFTRVAGDGPQSDQESARTAVRAIDALTGELAAPLDLAPRSTSLIPTISVQSVSDHGALLLMDDRIHYLVFGSGVAGSWPG